DSRLGRGRRKVASLPPAGEAEQRGSTQPQNATGNWPFRWLDLETRDPREQSILSSRFRAHRPTDEGSRGPAVFSQDGDQPRSIEALDSRTRDGGRLGRALN